MAQTAPITDTPIWDRIYLPSTTSPLENLFFAVPRGQPDPNNSSGGAKTKADTSMTRASTLPEPESFTVRKIRLILDANTAEADFATIVNTSWLELRTSGGAIIAWEAPSYIVPAGVGLVFTKSNASTGQNGMPSPAAVYTLVRPVELFIGEQFNVHIFFSSTPTFAAAVKIRCVLEGDHYMIDVVDPASKRSLRRAA